MTTSFKIRTFSGVVNIKDGNTADARIVALVIDPLRAHLSAVVFWTCNNNGCITGAKETL